MKKHTPRGLIIAVMILAVTVSVVFFRFVFLFDWNSKTNNIFQDVGGAVFGSEAEDIENDLEEIRNGWYDTNEGE